MDTEELAVGQYAPARRPACAGAPQGCIPAGSPARPNLYVETTRFRSKAEKQAVLQAQLEGLDEFERVFGFRSRTLIPANYTWSPDFNSAVAQAGVEGVMLEDG